MSGWTYSKAPSYHQTAVATKKGWSDPVTGEVLVAIGNLDQKKIIAGVVPTYTLTVPASKTYATGDLIAFVVTPAEAVNVGGTPVIALTIGSKSTNLVYNPASSTPTSLSFEYTVVSGDAAPSGVVVDNKITLTTVGKGKSAITDRITGGGGEPIDPTTLTFTVPSTANVKVLGA